MLSGSSGPEASSRHDQDRIRVRAAQTDRVMGHRQHPGEARSNGPEPWSVLWTRGHGCEELAKILGNPVFAEGNLREKCIEARADLVVQRRLTSFDLVDSVASNQFDAEQVTSVMAAVGEGPHSLFAGRVAQQIAGALGVPGCLVSAARNTAEDLSIRENLDRIGEHVPALERRLEQVTSAGGLLSTLDDGALLVLGAPGGSWLQRQFFGPGRQLIHAAPGGIVVVRSSPRRCFQAAEPAEAIAPWLSVSEAAKLGGPPVIPVAAHGSLVGLFRLETALDAAGEATVQDVMEEPVFLAVDDPIDTAGDLGSFFDGAPIPIVDHDGRLIGVLPI